MQGTVMAASDHHPSLRGLLEQSPRYLNLEIFAVLQAPASVIGEVSSFLVLLRLDDKNHLFEYHNHPLHCVSPNHVRFPHPMRVLYPLRNHQCFPVASSVPLL